MRKDLPSSRTTLIALEHAALLNRMQTPRARRGMELAFNASPVVLGRAALRASQKHLSKS